MSRALGIVNFVIFCAGFLWSVIAAAFRLDYIGGYLAIALGLIVGIIQLFADKDGKQVNNTLIAMAAFLAFTATYFPIAALYMGDTVMTLVINLAGLFGPIAIVTGIRAMLRIALKR